METTQKPDILKYAFMVTLTLFVVGLNASLSLKELTEVVMVILALFTIRRFKEWPKFDKKFLAVLFLWIAGAFVSYYVFAPIDIPVGKTELPNFRWIFFFFAVVILAKFYLDWDWLQKMLAVVFAVSFIADLGLYFQTGGRAGGLTYNPINFANIIAPFVLISWVFVLYGLTQKKYNLWFWLHSFCVVVGTFLVLASQTRGVIIALFPTMIIVSLLYGWKMVCASVLTVTLIFGLGTALSPDLRARFFYTDRNQMADYSRITRFAFWKANYEIWQEHPIFGVGYGVNNFLYYDKLDDSTKVLIEQQPDLKIAHAHNQYIQILAGGGAWGLTLFLTLLGIIYFGLRRSYKDATNILSRTWSLAFLAALTCFLIAGGTEANFSVTKNRYIFVLILALIVAFIQQMQKTKESPQ